MLYIRKGEEPQFLTAFKEKYPQQDYDSEEFAVNRPRLKADLIKEQKGLCAYCCARITEAKSHNEHIEPRHPGSYESKRSLDYMNIVASCDNPKTCGKKKGNSYDEDKFVSPLDKNCDEKFEYYPNGEMVGDDYTIEQILNLNYYELKNARSAVFKSLQNLDKNTIQECYMNEDEEDYQPYYNVIKWFWKTL